MMESEAEKRARAAYAAGFRGNDLLNIVAIGLAEGNGQGAAGEQGPWQIHPTHFDIISMSAAQSYDEAAKFAAALTYGGSYNGKPVQREGFGAWSTWLNKSYQRFIPDAVAAMQTLYREGHVDVTSPTSAVPGVQPGTVDATTTGGGPSLVGLDLSGLTSGFDTIGGALKAVSAKGFWPKISLTFAAGAMILTGMLIYTQRVPAVRVAEKDVTKTAATATAA